MSTDTEDDDLPTLQPFAPRVTIFVPEASKNGVYWARCQFLGEPYSFSTRLRDHKEAYLKALEHLRRKYVSAGKPPCPSSNPSEYVSVIDHALADALHRCADWSQFRILSRFLDDILYKCIPMPQALDACAEVKERLVRQDAKVEEAYQMGRSRPRFWRH